MHDKSHLIENTIVKTKLLCSHENLSDFSLCNTSLKILDQIFPSLNLKLETLKSLIGQTRQKRGFFDGIGSIFKIIFGTLDHDDAIKYNEAIKNLNHDEKETIKLLKDQTLVVKSTIENFNNTITNLNKNEKIFNQNLETIESFTRSAEKKFFDIRLKQNIDEHFSLLILMINELDKEYSDLLSALLLTKNNILHPIFISPQQFINEIQKTLPYLPVSTDYPTPINIEHYHQLSQILDINVFRIDNKLIIVTLIPLVEELNFDLYNLIPLPTKSTDNHYIFILPKSKYVTISQNKLQYSLLSDFQKCKKLSPINFICEQTEPIYSVHVKPICETELLFSNFKIPNSCDTRLSLINDDIFHRLHESNSWMYVLPTPTSVTINCKKLNPIDVQISRTGIITLKSSCKAYTRSTVLTTIDQTYHSDFISILPTIDIIADDCCIKNNERNLSQFHLTPLKSNDLNIEELKLASHKLNKINEMAEQLSNDNSLINKLYNNSYFSYIICTIIKALFLYLLYKLYKRLRKSRCFSQNPCCSTITNCLTFNICKTKTTNKVNPEIDIEINEIELQQPRRSSRLAKLKDKL